MKWDPPTPIVPSILPIVPSIVPSPQKPPQDYGSVRSNVSASLTDSLSYPSFSSAGRWRAAAQLLLKLRRVGPAAGPATGKLYRARSRGCIEAKFCK